ncbi:MAG: transcriptional repressor [Bacillota bacterium]|nr:transcriptional repressor [Bacillota bacterium]
MKYSRQREIILNTVMENPVHPTADMVYSILREENPNISLGTVYRNLNYLAAEGIIRKVTMPEGCDRFDGVTKPHYHMVCESCGTVVDCPLTVMTGFESKIMKETGFLVLSHRLIVYGRCAKCGALPAEPPHEQ